MKLDLGMHIVMHLVSFRKSGVTVIRGAILEVRVAFSDSPPWACGWSALPSRTVLPLHADSPSQAVQIA
jgi:hypothetical protein